jgi:hypothetical protein
VVEVIEEIKDHFEEKVELVDELPEVFAEAKDEPVAEPVVEALTEVAEVIAEAKDEPVAEAVAEVAEITAEASEPKVEAV